MLISHLIPTAELGLRWELSTEGGSPGRRQQLFVENLFGLGLF